MSGSRCSVCEHPQEAEIAREFLAGEHLRSLGDKFSVSKSALSRHFRDHTNNKALQKAATVRRTTRKRSAPVDVGEALQGIAAMLQGVLDRDPGSAQATAQIAGALVRTLEFLEKREAQGDKANKGAGLEKLANVFDTWPVQRILLTLGRCPHGGPFSGTCGAMLSCPTHGELRGEEMFDYVKVRAVADHLEVGGI